MDKNQISWKKYLPVFVLGVALIVFYKTFDSLPEIFAAIGAALSLLTPFIIGLGLAFFLYPATVSLESKLALTKKGFIVKRKKTIAIMSIYIIFLAILGVAIGFIIPWLSQGAADLIKKVPGFITELQRFFADLTREGGLVSNLRLNALLEEIDVQDFAKSFFKADLWGYVEGVTSAATSVLLGLVICLYALLERDALFRTARRFFSLFFTEEKLDKAGDYVHRISAIFYKFFFGKAIDSLIIGILAFIGFLFLGVPYAPIMAVITAIFNMIPYFGPFIGAVPPVLIALFMGDGYLALWTALFILILQQFDGNLLGPWILGDSVGVSPFWIIFAIVLFGGLFGFWGMLLGVPLVATIQMFGRDILEDNREDMSTTIKKKLMEE